MSSKYVHPSSIYLTEDEYGELLRNIAVNDLRRKARRRGFVFSLVTSQEEIISSLSVVPSEWTTVMEVHANLRAVEGVERLAPKSIKVEGDPTTVLQRMQRCLERRNEEGSEIINCQLNADGSLEAVSKHLEWDPTKSEIYSKTEQTNRIRVRRVDTGLIIEHASTAKGFELAEAVLAEAKLEKEDVVQEDVSLFGVRNPEQRSAFFVSLINSIQNWRCMGAPTVTVSRLLEADEPNGIAEEGEDRDSEEKEEIAEMQVAMAKALTITGSNVLSTEIYKRASAEGFFISTIRWTAQWESDSEVFVELSAGFKDAPNARNFFYGVCKSFRSDDPRFERCETRAMTAAERRKLQSLVSDAAFRILASLKGVSISETSPTSD